MQTYVCPVHDDGKVAGDTDALVPPHLLLPLLLQHDEAAYQKRLLRKKLKALKRATIIGFDLDNPAKIKKESAFMDNIMNRIIANLQLRIKNLHIRYENDFLYDVRLARNESAQSKCTTRPRDSSMCRRRCSQRPMAISFTFDQLALFTTDPKWMQAFYSDPSTIFKARWWSCSPCRYDHMVWC